MNWNDILEEVEPIEKDKTQIPCFESFTKSKCSIHVNKSKSSRM